MKKLTAGIFTVMLGLCATSGADAAVASKGYVDTKVGVNTQSIETLTQTVADNKTEAANAIAGVESAYKAADQGLQTAIDAKVAQSDYNTKVAALEKADTDNLAAAQTYAEGKASAAQAAAEATAARELSSAVSTLEGKITSAGTDTAALTERVTTAEGKITTAEGEIDDLQESLAEGGATSNAIAAAKQAGTDAVAALETYKGTNDAAVSANTEAISAINNADTGILAEAKKYADANDADTIYDDTTVKADIAKNAQAIAANELAIGSNAGEISGLKTLVGTTAVATQISQAVEAANLSQKNYTDGALTAYTKTEALGKLAMKDTVGTNDIDNGAVTAVKLAENAVTNAAVANGALSQDKIDGLGTTLATKLNIPTAANETDGKYVLTATASNGQATYYWESIAREGEE